MVVSKTGIRIRQIEFRTHGHATESVDKIVELFNFILPANYNPKKVLNIEHLTGTYGNPIRVITFQFQKKQDIDNIISHLSNALLESDKEFLRKQFNIRIDDKNRFFFRIMKQPLSKHQVLVGQGSDTVQIILSFIRDEPSASVSPEKILILLRELKIL